MRYFARSFAAATVMLAASAAFAGPRVIFTEIMYNPASDERRNQSEWIEIANVGDETIEIKNWTIKLDGKRARWGTFECTLAPGGIAVLINADHVTEEQFRSAWDPEHQEGSEAPAIEYQVIAVKWGALANDLSAEYPLQMIDAEGEVVAEVRFADEWPRVRGSGGPSIYLTDATASEWTDGKLWKVAEIGVDGHRHNRTNAVFDKQDTGSPGYVPGLSPAIVVAAPVTNDPPIDQPSTDSPQVDDPIDY